MLTVTNQAQTDTIGESELQALFRGYVEAKQPQSVLDYDDLLLFWAEMVTEPVLAEELANRFEPCAG